jgi:RNA polymerase sigma-70 factor (ECF subfamily)
VAAQSQSLEHERRNGAPETLGDVLYPVLSSVPASEADWVRLVHSIAEGDQLALHALYERAHRLVFTLTMRIAGNRETAEELTLDVFYDIWRRASRYDERNGTVLGWIMNQARSRAIDRLRFEQRQKRVDPRSGDPVPEEPGELPDILDLEEQSGALQKAVTALPAGERQAIEAAYFAGLTHAEVAARLGQPLGTIKTRIRSALGKLRQALAGKENP